MKKTTLTLALIALGTAALAHGGVKDKDVMARMMVMETIGNQMKLLSGMAKGEVAFDADSANGALVEVAAHAAQIPAMFETPATDPKSEALPVIWEEFDAFTEKAKATEAAAEQLAGTISAQGDVGAALGQIGVTCKACHDDYRD